MFFLWQHFLLFPLSRWWSCPNLDPHLDHQSCLKDPQTTPLPPKKSYKECGGPLGKFGGPSGGPNMVCVVVRAIYKSPRNLSRQTKKSSFSLKAIKKLLVFSQNDTETGTCVVVLFRKTQICLTLYLFTLSPLVRLHNSISTKSNKIGDF